MRGDVAHPAPPQTRFRRETHARLQAVCDDVAERHAVDRLRKLTEAREKSFHVMKLAQAHTPYDVEYAARRERDWQESVRAWEEAAAEMTRADV